MWHDVMIVKVAANYQGEPHYRVVCSCGWRGADLPSTAQAGGEGADHLAAMDLMASCGS